MYSVLLPSLAKILEISTTRFNTYLKNAIVIHVLE